MVEINLALESGELVSKSPSYLNKEQRQNAGTNTSDKYDKLKKLKDLYDSGVLTDEEYKIEKEKILNEPTK
ncbi:MAG: SHOCT domain-containing protein [Paludibacteraceae bacterium]|nr:SHOCT domain-containing protein [Paludibacteraceae bacterium]